MATYKVLQDIEAEDKLLGPLTLRQFIYAGICALCLYLSFIVITKHVAFLVVIFAPVALFTGFFAFPWKLNQPTEVWALAKFRFLLKPRRRIWDQSGAKELVTITAPKKVEVNYTDGLSQNQVKSRLKALADTIDSRGWAVKNANVSMSDMPLAPAGTSTDDRLVGATNLPQEVPAIDIQASDDILDERSNPIAQQFDELIKTTSKSRMQAITQNLQPKPKPSIPTSSNLSMTPPLSSGFAQQDIAEADNGQTNNPAPTVDYGDFDPEASQASGEGIKVDEKDLSKKLKQQRQQGEIAYQHLRTISPTFGKPHSKLRRRRPGFHKKSAPVTQTPDPAILKLANNNDLNVATLARQANKNEPQNMSDEVVINLH